MPNLNGNWVDLIIIVIFVFFITEALRLGFWVMLIDFFSFLASLIIALRGYPFVASFLKANFNLSRSLANALGFLLAAILSEAILGFFLAKLVTKIPERYTKAKLNKFLGIVPAVGEAAVLASFIIILVLGFPIASRIKTDISDSKIGGFLVQKTAGVEAGLSEVFGGIIEDSLTYLTVKPGSRERIPLNVEKQELTADEDAEIQMLKLVNKERTKRGVAKLEWRPEAVGVAREYAKDMWERGYFGHISLEGKDVGDRLDNAKVSYTFAGENLALAPTVLTAMNGLMASTGHKENILESGFKQVGIGVINNGVYGKMFVQIFTD